MSPRFPRLAGRPTGRGEAPKKENRQFPVRSVLPAGDGREKRGAGASAGETGAEFAPVAGEFAARSRGPRVLA